MNNLISEKKINCIATNFLAKIYYFIFFPDVTAVPLQLHLHVEGVLLCF